MNYITEEGMSIEPDFYVPVIPLVLANGVEGIGTGWATFIPQFSPIDLINNIRR
jgi:DNA topoisomerase-2